MWLPSPNLAIYEQKHTNTWLDSYVIYISLQHHTSRFLFIAPHLWKQEKKGIGMIRWITTKNAIGNDVNDQTLHVDTMLVNTIIKSHRLIQYEIQYEIS